MCADVIEHSLCVMDALVDKALRTFISDCKDVFGENPLFLRFKLEQGSTKSEAFKSKPLFGRIMYKNVNGNICVSPPLMLKTMKQTASAALSPKLEFVNEILFYSQLLPFFLSLRDLSHLFPKYYSSQLNANYQSFKGVFVFENLQASGFKTSDAKSFLDYDHLALMMRKLGEFHAYSYRAKRTDLTQFLTLAESFAQTHNILLERTSCFIPVGLRGVQPLQNDTQYSCKVAKLEEFLKSSPEIVKEILYADKADPLAVLCHGDYLRSNILFKYEKGKPVDLKLIDMATCKLASPVFDIAQVLYINADQITRDRHWNDLIDEYYRALKDTFPNSEVPPKESILTEIQCKSSFVYIIASFFLTWLIAADNGLPSVWELLPLEYRDIDAGNLPSEELTLKAFLTVGGNLGTKALADILKDMINRGIL